jgi:hypothetical protein
LLEAMQFPDKFRGAGHIRIIEIETAIVPIGVGRELRIANSGDLFAGGLDVGLIGNPVAVIADGDAGEPRIPPKVTGGRKRCRFSAFIVVSLAALAITVGPKLFDSRSR